MINSWYHFQCIDQWALVSLMVEVFYRYLYCTLIGLMSTICMCIGRLGFFVHRCGVLSHMFYCIDCQKVSVHWCGCYIKVLHLSCMVVMILVVIWASCDWITSHVLGILLLALSLYNLVRVHFHDSVRSVVHRHIPSAEVFFFFSFGSSGSCHQGGALMNPSFLSVSVGPSPSHY